LTVGAWTASAGLNAPTLGGCQDSVALCVMAVTTRGGLTRMDSNSALLTSPVKYALVRYIQPHTVLSGVI